jgi:glycosyltransferase involved in cell wall biosynthesis
MKVGYVAYGLDRALSGISRYTLKLVKSLTMLDPRLETILLQAGGLGPVEKAGEFDTVRLAGSRLLPGLMTVGQVAINRAAQRLKLDVLHDPTGVTPFSLTNGRFRTIVTVHDVFAWSLPGHSSRLDTLIYKHWLPRVLPQVDAVITDSHQSKRDIIHFLPIEEEKVTVAPIGVDRHFRVLSTEEVQHVLGRYCMDVPYILYVGSIAARKNLPRLLEAYARLRNWSSNWRLVIAGTRGWKSSPVYETVERLELAGCVHFTGYVEEEDLPALYNGADLFVFPSLYEGFGLPVLEAMACGAPVVTSNTSSLPEVAGDATLLADPEDVEAITEAMRRVLADRALAKELQAKGLERAEQFTWERTARETIAVYEKVLGQKIAD